ncbi:hypothetical protein [Paraburkholderia phenoliruptrix]|nr:hypothetical protein [Paraburkholderia phenoliruptrix]
MATLKGKNRRRRTVQGRLGKQREGQIGGSRGDFMEALGEAVYAGVTAAQLNGIVAADLTLQDVIDAKVDNLDEEADEAIDGATSESNETVGTILGV